MKSPRLLLINYEFPPLGGGAGTATAALAREFAAQGADVCVLTSAFGDLPRFSEENGFRVHRIPVIRRRADRSSVFEMITFMLSAAWHGLRLTRNWRPDASLAFFGIPGGPVALWLKWTRGIPYVVSLRGGDVPGHQAGQLDTHHRLTRPFIRIVWRHARRVVANSIGLRDQALRTAPSLNIPVIPNGVDTTQFSPPSPQPSAFSPPPSSVIPLLYVGRLSPEKGLADALTALATLREIPWTFTIIGDGPDRDALEARATQLGLAERVTFAGWLSREKLPDAYRAARIFLFPSTDEGMPNTVLEAMASGLPVIARRIAGCEDLIRNNQTGILVPTASIPALTDAIDTLLRNTTVRASMGSAARTRALSHFSWEKSPIGYRSLLTC
ncbi:MAG: glycosyltransferase, partial [Verrucomicrobia bacterium]|nr:glycosyltransferase [Verrucomicrobiota bacterium]